MFETNSPLGRLSNIYCRVGNLLNEYELKDWLSAKEPDLPASFVIAITEMGGLDEIFGVYSLFKDVLLRQKVEVGGEVMHLLSGKKADVDFQIFQNQVHLLSGAVAAKHFLTTHFDLEPSDIYPHCLTKIATSLRAKYILMWAAVYATGDSVSGFKSHLSSLQILEFDTFAAQCTLIRERGEALWKEKKILLDKIEELTKDYTNSGYVFLQNGEVEIMDFNIWAEQQGCLDEYNKLKTKIESMVVSPDQLIQQALI